MSTAASTPTPPPAAGPKPVFRPHSTTRLQRWAARLIWSLVMADDLTQRYRVTDPHGSVARALAEPVIFAIWHNRLAFSLRLHQRLVRRRLPGRRMAALVSASRDGALLTGVLEAFDVQPVRGSSSRRGHQALLELKSWADRGLDLAITPDGPRGPRYVVQPGVLALARVTGRPIIPAATNLTFKAQLKSWDRFQVPLPFGGVEVCLGPALHVPEGSDEDLEAMRLELERRLLAITRD